MLGIRLAVKCHLSFKQLPPAKNVLHLSSILPASELHCLAVPGGIMEKQDTETETDMDTDADADADTDVDCTAPLRTLRKRPERPSI